MNNVLIGQFAEYCERVGDSFSEPLNAFSNLAFLVSAFLLFRFIKKNPVNQTSGWFLNAVIIILGVGSFVWHFYRNQLGYYMDVISLYVFILFISFFLIHKLTQKIKLTVLVFGLTAGLYYILFTYFPQINVLSGLSKYIFALCVFSVINYFIIRKYGSEHSFSLPLVVFAVSIIFRGLDLVVCPSFPYGTHFVWHIGVATATYMTARSVLVLK